MSQSDESIRKEILTQIANARSVAPREIAIALAEKDTDWRTYLPRIRSMATLLSHENQLVFVRKKKVVSPEGLRGVYRLAIPDQYARDE
ncbi:DUF3253 domain-containing protein [Kordiimonas aquimaris]|uniref:DUF3253 domain-containing protein n=1 Tax=Kordiimonas aquimaris TaxID=707591 RepID=UPI0021CFAF74|nr:DUF3253 domain-containing protein [Kordiimonas aquimaris]